MLSFRKRYIRLGTNLLAQERLALERNLHEALQPVWPNDTFVQELEQELLDEAQQSYESRQRLWHDLRIVGLVSGGLLSIMGGVLMWLLWRQNQAPDTTSSAKSGGFNLPKLTKLRPASLG